MTQKQRNALIAGVIAVVLVVIVGIGWAIQSNRDTSGEAGDRPGDNSSETVAIDVKVAAEGDYGLGVGDPEAPVKVEIFEDFQCGHCADFKKVANDELLAAAQDGSAYVVYRPMAFLNEWSVRAMNALGVVLDEAGGQAALKLHDLLFANQPSGTVPSDDEIVALAVQAGASESDVRKGIEDLSFRQWVVNATDDASKRGVTGTPTVFINGKPVGGQTIDELTANTFKGINAG
ncbi:protein-disulfide isomerase [Nocardioides daedukensis]|uniref:Protein-disulfide isomerase n=1 Tax=Nocardioides daedukensis TaxID=634462 RepID=A0A7Y9RY07_9ACTN|nr:thioredoxin domain-containing protein [Nocardioides daedukensis]NYG58330.1 protein-disulfide isomerase [Nocardioides daedukensis]